MGGHLSLALTNNLKITYTSIKITKLQFTTCANKERVLKYTLLGGVAQLVERSVRIRKVKSSTLSVSTTEACYFGQASVFLYIEYEIAYAMKYLRSNISLTVLH